jgi:hypothetical protein
MTRHFWTNEELDFLVLHYANQRAQTIADQLGKSVKSVYQQAHRLKLRKSEDFMHTHWSGRLGHGQGVDTRFKPGHQTWSKGKKLGAEWGRKGRMPETQFKKGLVAHNWAPVGTVRDIDGYYQVKLLPKGKHTETYRFVHHLVWELHHGPIPPKHLVRFRDGDRHNTDPANLELLDLRSNSARNSIHAYPQQVKELFYLKGRITKAIRGKEKESHEQHQRTA